jgi:hypothetical protein
MALEFTAEKLFERVIEKTIWFYLPFYAIYRLGKELFQEIFSRGENK